MNNIKRIANEIYSHCIYAMDYDMMGLTFNPSSLESAFKNHKEELVKFSQDEFEDLIDALSQRILEMFNTQQIYAEAEVDKSNIVEIMAIQEAREEMEEYGSFLTYVKSLSYKEFKSIVAE